MDIVRAHAATQQVPLMRAMNTGASPSIIYIYSYIYTVMARVSRAAPFPPNTPNPTQNVYAKCTEGSAALDWGLVKRVLTFLFRFLKLFVSALMLCGFHSIRMATDGPRSSANPELQLEHTWMVRLRHFPSLPKERYHNRCYVPL